MPTSPARFPAPSSVSMRERRLFLGVMLAAVGGLIGAALAVPLARFSAFPLHDSTEEASWSDVGKIDEFRSLTEPVSRAIDVKTVEGYLRSLKPLDQSGGQK